MPSITAFERETIILYNDAEDEADIYTYDRALQRLPDEISAISLRL
jgi:hypothetical protein